MPRISALSHSLPEHLAHQQDVRELAARLFCRHVEHLDERLGVFDHALIRRRPLIRPLSWYLDACSPKMRNDIYRTEGLALAEAAARKCLEKAGLAATDIDHIIFVSTTGFSTPSLDCHLINRLGMGRSTSRAPLWGLGCAGGAVGLSRALDYCRAWPMRRVLLVTLELCSLTFIADDKSLKNLVATALFSDAAAAAVIEGEHLESRGPRLLASGSHLFEDSYALMGWDFTDQGMELVLSPRLPAVVNARLKGIAEDFLNAQRVRREQLKHFLCHPGGAKILDAYARGLEIGDEELQHSVEVLRSFGNLSSSTLLLVLEHWMESKRGASGELALACAFGPGFSAEMLLLEC